MLDFGEKGDKVWLQLEDVNAGQLACGMGVYVLPENEVVNTDTNVEVSSADESVGTLTPEEERYKEEILFCMEDDGVISEDERGYLERKRKKYRKIGQKSWRNSSPPHLVLMNRNILKHSRKCVLRAL